MKSAQRIQHVRQVERGSLTDLGRLLGESAAPQHPTPLASVAVADLPAAADYEGHVLYCSNGAGGSPILAFSNGTNWLRSDTGAAVAAA